ncbi:MAG: hypothetical protein WC071_03160 [Victivallaceae bacterium]
MAEGEEKTNWPLFCLHLFFGAIFGAVLGYFVLDKSGLEKSCFYEWIFIGGGALLIGAAAGYLREEFWETLKERHWWWRV